MSQGLFMRLVLMVSRGVLSLVDDKQSVQSVQVQGYEKEVLPDVEHLQPYGFTAVPVPGAEAVVLSPAGMRDSAFVVLVEDRRYRVKSLGHGEVAVYDDKNQVIHLAKDGVHVTTPKDLTATVGGSLVATVTGSATVKANGITFDSPDTHITGTLTVDQLITGKGGLAVSGGSGASVEGSLTTTGDVVAAGISLDAHTHTGVQSGDGSTGGPQ